MLLPVTLSVLAILSGILALLAGTDTVDVPGSVAVALLLLVLGGPLCVGAWWGRARWLIPVGVVLGVALAGATVADVPLRGEVGDRTYRPQSVSDLQSSYRLTAGDLVVDLGAIDLAATTRTVVITVGAGDLRVMVPDGADVVVDSHAGVGSASVFRHRWDGLGTDRHVVEAGREGGGRLVLRVRVGFGDLEVQRASS